MSTTDTGTIDVTNLVGDLQSTFVLWAVKYAYAAIIVVPGLSWIALPGVSDLVQDGIEWLATLLSGSAILQAFMLNTAIRKASQAQDFQDAVNAVKALPTTVTDEEYSNAEQTQINAFHNFVMVTN